MENDMSIQEWIEENPTLDPFELAEVSGYGIEEIESVIEELVG
jgi:hypothetical protein